MCGRVQLQDKLIALKLNQLLILSHVLVIMSSDLSLQHDMHIAKSLTLLKTFGTFGTIEAKISLCIASSVPN